MLLPLNIKKNNGAVTQFKTALHLLQFSFTDGGIVISLKKFAGISQRKVNFSIRSILDHSSLVFKNLDFILFFVATNNLIKNDILSSGWLFLFEAIEFRSLFSDPYSL